MSQGKAAAGIKRSLGVVGVVTFGALCCGGAPIALGAIAGVGLGGVLGGIGGAVVVTAMVVGLLLVRRARRARGGPGVGSAEDCCTPLSSETPARERAGTR